MFTTFFTLLGSFKQYNLTGITGKTYVPVSSSYIRIPRDQKSTDLSWPLLRMISGATYSGVPQNVQVLQPGSSLLENPKSTSLT